MHKMYKKSAWKRETKKSKKKNEKQMDPNGKRSEKKWTKIDKKRIEWWYERAKNETPKFLNKNEQQKNRTHCWTNVWSVVAATAVFTFFVVSAHIFVYIFIK